jgi:hypothetical protein
MAGEKQARGAKRAGELAAQAQKEATAEQRRQYDVSRTDLAPWRETGQTALQQYAALYGIGRQRPPALAAGGVSGGFQQPVTNRLSGAVLGTTGADSPVMIGGSGSDGLLSRDEMQDARSRFQETPGYQFSFDEGVRALDRSASARGILGGGGYGRELTRYGQGMASQEFGNYANRLASIAGMGQQATTTGVQAGMQTARNISGIQMAGGAQQGAAMQNAATARASGYAGVGSALNKGMENYLTYRGLS